MTLTRKLRSLCTRQRAAALAASAGRADPAPRRGSVLVLVLGALALISVVTLVYVTVGKGDIRTAAVTVDRNRVDTAVETIGDYLNDVISRSTLATFVDGVDGNTPVLIRKTWDFPFVDSYRRSVTNIPSRAFNATGSFADLAVSGPDIRLPYQPWLSTTAPSDLLAANLNAPLPADAAQDWGMISNFAPDGRFVNLWNLAPYVGGQRISRFDALPVRPNSNGTPNAPNASTSEMSYGVTSLDQNGRSYNAGASQLPGGLGPADPNIPAHWTMWQQKAFRLSGKDPNFGPSDYQYAPYQWCDTDGDGFYDSRWIELVNATNPDNPISILPRDDRFRWFIAARAVDLNALININTATDLRVPPRQTSGATLTQTSPLGLTPSDIDLYRVLRMEDPYQTYQLGYEALESPIGDPYYGVYDQGLARRFGERAYNAMRLSLKWNNVQVAPPGTDLTTASTAADTLFGGDSRVQYYQLWGAQSGGGYYVSGGASRFSLSAQFNAADLLELLTYRGVNNPTVTSRLEQAADGRGDNPNESRMGPFRSARTRGAEVGTADNDGAGGTGNGLADLDAFIRSVTDVRQHLTTISHDRPFTAKVVSSNPAAAPSVGKLADTELTTYAVGAVKATGSPTDLFTGYCDALLPYSARPNFWTTNYNRFRTLNFAHNPELALRFAAHLTANFRDMYDKSDTESRKQPGAYTLLIDASQRNALQSNQTNFPWWSANGRLDLDPNGNNNRLPNTATNITTQALNIFGIEAQPFITQVSSIHLYTDAPVSAGGDDEDPSGTAGEEITIRGGYSPPVVTGSTGGRVSRDFLGQILAFQITNPFDEDVALSQWDHTTNFQSLTTDTFTDYYLEYNGNLFKFAAESTGAGEGIILRKGETRNFYVLSNPIPDMQARFTAVGGATVPRDAVQRFIDNQLSLPALPGYTYTAAELDTASNRVKPIRLKGMSATDGRTVAYTGDLFTGTGAARKTVYLWRKLDAQATSGSARPPGGRTAHMLADRLFDPGTATDPTAATLDRKLPIGGTNGNGVNSSQAGPEGDASFDNTGFTIALWGSVKRPDNPVKTPIGAIPAYCLEARWSSGNLRNIAETDGVNLASIARNDFINKPNADITVIGFLNKTMINLTGGVRPPASNPGLYPGVIITAGGTYATMTAPASERSYTGHRIGNNGNGVAYANLYPQIALDNNEFEETLGVAAPAATISTLRVADLLLPLAIGPEFDPGPSPSAIPAGQSIPPARCMTLSEALALGLNYSNPPQTGDPFSIYHKIGDNGQPARPPVPGAGALDRGNLNLTRFAPFEDLNGDGAYQPAPSGSDVSRWPGIPMALNVLNVFSTMDLQFSGLTKGTPGRINVNTATLPVLRSVPLFSPSLDASTVPGAPGQAWPAFKSLSGVAPTEQVLTDVTSDIAAGVIAYRDKTRVVTRDAANPGVPNFEDTTIDPFVPVGADGRAVTTQIEAIREATGFTSVAELMAITSRTNTSTQRLRISDRMDQLGIDNNRSGTNGTVSVRYENTAGTKVVDAVTDDYAEKLLVAQAAMNSVTVRSDVFAVWFVVHGYQRSDTENLGANDPLVPTVAKRFVMVLDRSNVTRAGEKAKVLLFKELPMTP